MSIETFTCDDCGADLDTCNCFDGPLGQSHASPGSWGTFAEWSMALAFAHDLMADAGETPERIEAMQKWFDDRNPRNPQATAPLSGDQKPKS